MRKYRLVAKKGEGTFSEVLKAQNVKDGKYHAIKCMKNRFESIDQVNNLREIQALRRLSPHEHIITLEEVLYDQPTGRLALVFELMDANLYELIRGRKHYLNPQLIKSYMWQLMKSLDHMHKKGIFHRDIKPENILIESCADVGRGLKLADLGSCRGIYSKQPYTEYISTRWYRAPECLLTDGYYGPEMDLWGAGCVMFEITSLYPLFPGTNEVDQVNRIHKVLGSPSDEILAKFKSKGASHISFDFTPQKGIGIPQLIPHASADTIDLIERLLAYDGSMRISAREAMRHTYFKEVRDAEAKRTQAASATGAVASTQAVSGGTADPKGSTADSEKKMQAYGLLDEGAKSTQLQQVQGQSLHQQQQQQQAQVIVAGSSSKAQATNTGSQAVPSATEAKLQQLPVMNVSNSKGLPNIQDKNQVPIIAASPDAAGSVKAASVVGSKSNMATHAASINYNAISSLPPIAGGGGGSLVGGAAGANSSGSNVLSLAMNGKRRKKFRGGVPNAAATAMGSSGISAGTVAGVSGAGIMGGSKRLGGGSSASQQLGSSSGAAMMANANIGSLMRAYGMPKDFSLDSKQGGSNIESTIGSKSEGSKSNYMARIRK